MAVDEPDMDDGSDGEWETVKERIPTSPRQQREPGRSFPARFTDQQVHPAPAPTPPVEAPPGPVPANHGQATLKRTATNKFGIFHIWNDHPVSSPPPDNEGIISDVPTFSEAIGAQVNTHWWKGFGQLREGLTEKAMAAWAPFANSTIFRLVRYYYTSFSDASIAGFNHLVRDVLKAPDFKISDIPDDFDLQSELQKLDSENSGVSPFAQSSVWYDGTVEIPLPAEGKKHQSEERAPKLTVGGVLHRKLVEVIKSAFQGPDFPSYHFTPTQTYWKPDKDPTP